MKNQVLAAFIALLLYVPSSQANGLPRSVVQAARALRPWGVSNLASCIPLQRLPWGASLSRPFISATLLKNHIGPNQNQIEHSVELKREFAHFDPAHGFAYLNANILKNMYSSPDTEDGPIQLLKRLFHKVGDTLSITHVPSSPVTYFTIDTVGKILNSIHRISEKDLSDPQVQNSLTEEIKKIIRETSTSQVKNNDLNQFVRTLVKSVVQSKDKASFYPNEQTELLLLSYFWEKGENKEDIARLFEHIPYTLKVDSRYVLDRESPERKKWVESRFAPSDASSQVPWYLSDEPFALYENYFIKLRENFNPPLERTTTVFDSECGVNYANCGEVSVLNLFRNLLNKQNKFSPEILKSAVDKGITPTQAFLEYFEKFPDFIRLNEFASQAFWSNYVVARKTSPRVSYLKKEQVEMGPGLNNALNLIENLIFSGDPNFRKLGDKPSVKLNYLCQVFSTPETKWSWTSKSHSKPATDTDMTVDFFNDGVFSFSWRFFPRHFEVENASSAAAGGGPVVSKRRKDVVDRISKSDAPPSTSSRLYLSAIQRSRETLNESLKTILTNPQLTPKDLSEFKFSQNQGHENDFASTLIKSVLAGRLHRFYPMIKDLIKKPGFELYSFSGLVDSLCEILEQGATSEEKEILDLLIEKVGAKELSEITFGPYGFKLFEYLIEKDPKGMLEDRRPVFRAINNGYFGILQFLLNKNLEIGRNPLNQPNPFDYLGETHLSVFGQTMVAAVRWTLNGSLSRRFNYFSWKEGANFWKFVDYLIKTEGQNINETSRSYPTLLNLAISWGDAENVKRLIALGADVNLKDKYHKLTPLQTAQFSPNSQAISQILIDHGALSR